MAAISISDIIRKIEERGIFKGIKRYTYMPYSLDKAVEVVEAIGRTRRKNFCIDDDNRFAYENIIRWIHGDKDMRCIDPATHQEMPGRLDAGIYIAGNSGSGKSWAMEIMSAYTIIDDVQITIGETRRCLRWPNVRADIICEEYTKTGLYEKYKKMPIICIQDLGSEQMESLYMGNRENVIRRMIEYRGDRTDMLTLITSNLPMAHQKLEEKYGDRVVSRLNEMCNYLEIKGKDRRMLRS